MARAPLLGERRQAHKDNGGRQTRTGAARLLNGANDDGNI
jgi:hypothetical protein